MSFWTRVRERSWKWPSLPASARRSLPLLSGVLLAGASLYLASSRISALKGRIEASTAPTEVVVASVPIPSGGAFAEGNLARSRLPACSVGRRHVPASEFHLLLGATAREALEPGEPVLWSDVNDPLEAPPLSDAVPQGRRAVTLPLDPSSSFSGLLRPGDRVDLLCTREGGSGGVALLEAVPVLAVGKNVSSPAGDNAESDEPLTATLSLLPSQVVAVLGAARSGSVQWVLRNGDDEGRSPSGNRPPRLEIWEGGVLWDRHAGL